MQHPFFSPLNEQELALLLVTLTVGGSSQQGIFAQLEPQTAARLQDRATALLQIGADRRVPLMVRELKAALAQDGRRGIERLDPSWIVHGLKGESPRVVAALLVGLPASVVRSVLRRLPATVRAALPEKREVKGLNPLVASGVRALFEARFAPMPERGTGPFCFADIVHLERSELFHLIRDLGLTELGQAFVSVGKMALLELCRRLPRAHAEELVAAVKAASRVDLPDPKAAQRFLSRVVVNFENTEEFLQKAGLWRLAKACLLEPKSFATVMGQRLPRRAAQYLHAYMEKAQEMEDVTQEAQSRLQDAILLRVVLLSRAGTLSEPLQHLPMQYRDASAAQEALSTDGSAAGGPPAAADAQDFADSAMLHQEDAEHPDAQQPVPLAGPDTGPLEDIEDDLEDGPGPSDAAADEQK
jgi:hypothetical protein